MIKGLGEGWTAPDAPKIMRTDFATHIVTPEQLAALPNDKDFELVDGQLVERKGGNKANWVATEFAIALTDHVARWHLGWVFGPGAGFRLDNARSFTVRKPDVSFVRFGRLPNEQPADAYDSLAPDLAVEVVSPNDTVYELDEKIDDYLRAGVRLVWVINPELQTVTIYRPGQSQQTIRGGDELDGLDVVPGFRCPVSALFAMPRP
jgi:Uma2 family endonuclease